MEHAYKYDDNDPLLKYILNSLDHKANENESMAVFSYPELVLLKDNENYRTSLAKMNGTSDSFLPLFRRGHSFNEIGVECKGEDGVSSFWDINAKVMEGDRNKRYIVASFYDASQRVLENRRNKKYKNEMKKVLSNLTDTINVINLKGEYIYINKTGEDKLAPYALDLDHMDSGKAYKAFNLMDINGKKIGFENIPDQRVLRGEKIEDLILIGTSHLATTYHKCNGRPIYDELGNIEGGILVYKDIEESFKNDEYSAFKENIKDISVYYAVLSYEDLKVMYVNEYVFESIKKGKPYITSISDIIGGTIFDFYEIEKQEIIQGIRQAAKDHSSYIHKFGFIEAGKTKYIKALFQPMYDADDQVEKIIAIGIDISDEVLEKQHMEKVLKAQEDMFINTSHELKTPLNLIFSATQLQKILLEDDSINESKASIKKTNRMTKESCYRMMRINNNILDISKAESGLYETRLENCNIVKVLEDIVELACEHTRSTGIEIINKTEVHEVFMAIDVSKFERMILNFISNAIKFSSPPKRIIIELVVKNEGVEIAIEDNGIGIAQENFHLIFEKFVQLDGALNRIAEGTGIGLSLVKFIAQLHGGHVRVESALGQGSKFIVTLPVNAAPSSKTSHIINYGNNSAERIKFELSDIYIDGV